MLKKLKHQFIATALFAVILIITIIIGSINFLNFRSLIANADDILDYLQKNKGVFIDIQPKEDLEAQDKDLSLEITPEMPYETRFFSVSFTSDRKVLNINVDKIAAIDKIEAEEIGRSILQDDDTRGFYASYRYLKSVTGKDTTIFFLDCTRAFNHALIFLLWSMITSIISVLAIFLLLTLVSRKVAKPFVENYEKQQRFITNAGHDIKTPLTIINADAELLELEYGQSEWIDDIKKQTARMTSLTTELIYLTKIDVSRDVKMMPFPISDVIEETMQSFSSVAATKNLKITANITPHISCKGDENSIRKLAAILFDNATKYTPSGEEIFVSLKPAGRNVHFRISNPAKDLTEEMTAKLFDRFYRSDSARSSNGGFGIGLSVAVAIVTAHKGKITAKKEGEHLAIDFII